MTEQEIQEKGYAHPEALVTTEWVAEHLDDTENIRIIESDEDVLLYYRGLSGTKASYATLAEISFPASAVILNWVFLGVTVTANQLAGFGLLWAAILALGYLNARDPLPAPPVGGLGAERTG